MPSLALLTNDEAARQFPSLRPFTADSPIHYLGAWRSAEPRHPDSPAIAHDPRCPAWVSASLSTQGQRPRLRVVWHFSPPAATEVESYYREIAPHLPGQVAAALDRAAIGLLLADLWRKEDECGLREIWDFAVTDAVEGARFLGTWDLPSGNRLDAVAGPCQCEERDCHNLAVGLMYVYAPTGEDSYVVRRRIAREVLARLAAQLGRPLARPRIDPHFSGNARLLVLAWEEAR